MFLVYFKSGPSLPGPNLPGPSLLVPINGSKYIWYGNKSNYSHYKTKLMLNDNTYNPRITIQNEQIEIVNHLQFLGYIIDEQGSKKEILAREAQSNQIYLILYEYMQ